MIYLRAPSNTYFGARKHWQINTYMKKYKAIVKASGLWVETIVFAQNSAQAYALFKSIFGSTNVPHMPTEIH